MPTWRRQERGGISGALDPDDDRAFRMSFLDICDGFVGRFEWKDLVHHRAYRAGLDERGDLAKLAAVGFHEKEGVVDTEAFGLSAGSGAQQAQDQFHEARC